MGMRTSRILARDSCYKMKQVNVQHTGPAITQVNLLPGERNRDKNNETLTCNWLILHAFD